MRNISFAINRRQALKLGAGSLFIALLTPLVFGQGNKSSAAGGSDSASASNKVDGVVSYNAGWVIALEDKAPLLEVEAKKNKEKEEQAKQKAGTSADANVQTKEKSKSISDKMKDFVTKIKSYF